MMVYINNLLIFRGQDVFILKTSCGSDEHQKKIEDLLHVQPQVEADDSGKYNEETNQSLCTVPFSTY